MNPTKTPSTPKQSATTSTNKTRRNRARYDAKKKKRAVASVVRRSSGPAKQYISDCCGLPGRKPRAAQKETVQDAETKKTKERPRGLGKWRCTGCGKRCTVKVRKPEATQEATVVAN